MFTLITSLYHSDRYLDKYVKNLKKFVDFLSKNGVDFEVIIIANNPSAKEKELQKIFAGEKWLVFKEVPREPLYISWNRGIEMARGDIIGFWNVDDIRYPEAMIDGLRLIKDGADVVYFPFIIKWYLNLFGLDLLVKKREIKPLLFDRDKFTSGMHCGPFMLIRKDFYRQVGPFDEQFKVVGDFDWCVRAAKISDKFVLSEKNGGVFRVDGGGLSAGGRKRHVLENNIVFARHKLPNQLNNFTEEEISKFKINQILYKNNFISL